MVQPQVADGEDGFQIWKVAVSTLYKQSQTADKGWSSSLGFESRGLTIPYHKIPVRYKMLHMPLHVLLQTW